MMVLYDQIAYSLQNTIMEGRAMVNAARKFGRTVQVGTHRRVSLHSISDIEFLKSGKIGKIGMVWAFVYCSGNAGKCLPKLSHPKD